MFIRVTTFEYPEDRQDEVLAWMRTKTDQVRRIDGLIAVDVFEPMPGQGVIVASYDDENAFTAAAGTIKEILGELAQFLSGPPVTLAGTRVWTTRSDLVRQ